MLLVVIVSGCPGVQGVLERILMRRDISSALSFAEGEIARLLSGKVEVWELAMTGGLWRVTGQQLAAAAAAAGESGGSGLLVYSNSLRIVFCSYTQCAVYCGGAARPRYVSDLVHCIDLFAKHKVGIGQIQAADSDESIFCFCTRRC